jgi:hypothetical protein
MDYIKLEGWKSGSVYVYLPITKQLYMKTSTHKKASSSVKENSIYYFECKDPKCKNSINFSTDCLVASYSKRYNDNHDHGTNPPNQLKEYKELLCYNEIRRRVTTEMTDIQPIFNEVINKKE